MEELRAEYTNTHLFAVFGEKDCCESSVCVFRVYSTANAVAPSTLGSKLLSNRVSVVEPDSNTVSHVCF